MTVGSSDFQRQWIRLTTTVTWFQRQWTRLTTNDYWVIHFPETVDETGDYSHLVSEAVDMTDD